MPCTLRLLRSCFITCTPVGTVGTCGTGIAGPAAGFPPEPVPDSASESSGKESMRESMSYPGTFHGPFESIVSRVGIGVDALGCPCHNTGYTPHGVKETITPVTPHDHTIWSRLATCKLPSTNTQAIVCPQPPPSATTIVTGMPLPLGRNDCSRQAIRHRGVSYTPAHRKSSCDTEGCMMPGCAPTIFRGKNTDTNHVCDGCLWQGCTNQRCLCVVAHRIGPACGRGSLINRVLVPPTTARHALQIASWAGGTWNMGSMGLSGGPNPRRGWENEIMIWVP
jgi:hypothetical protein